VPPGHPTGSGGDWHDAGLSVHFSALAVVCDCATHWLVS
jgi:hypothetical protein